MSFYTTDSQLLKDIKETTIMINTIISSFNKKYPSKYYIKHLPDISLNDFEKIKISRTNDSLLKNYINDSQNIKISKISEYYKEKNEYLKYSELEYLRYLEKNNKIKSLQYNNESFNDFIKKLYDWLKYNKVFVPKFDYNIESIHYDIKKLISVKFYGQLMSPNLYKNAFVPKIE